MGDPKKLKRKYESPKKIWDRTRIEEEQKLLEEFGLKNMHELRVMQMELKKIRREARRLLSMGEKGRKLGKPLLEKVVRLGIAKPDTSLEDLLSLTIMDVLDRRLETRVFKKGLVRSIEQGRQLIVHGHIAIEGRKISAPSYLVPVDEEDRIGYYKNVNFIPIVVGKAKESKEGEKVGGGEGSRKEE
ncbi:30S ribosomal protein S4 [Candidatus Micrarchaeota archaeon]|nr:30S ribosomal protein S4 [Candidatus Micrarchaeota archaeon]